MLMRLWFRPFPRPAADLDLVAAFPFSVEETARRFVPLLADRSVDDGVVFDPERFRVEGIWLNTDFPGVRLFASGEVEGVEDDFSVDVTFGEPLIPKPTLGKYPMEGCGQTARLWMCRPETIVGRKLHALKHMGMLHWRPKDLNDLRLLLERVPLDRTELPGAIAASFTSRGDAPGTARAALRATGVVGHETVRGPLAGLRPRVPGTGSSRQPDASGRGGGGPAVSHPGALAMSSNPARAFLEAILAQPDDDTPRLVYADWLEEQGDSARAEFIRVQIERARLPDWDARQVRLEAPRRRVNPAAWAEVEGGASGDQGSHLGGLSPWINCDGDVRQFRSTPDDRERLVGRGTGRGGDGPLAPPARKCRERSSPLQDFGNWSSRTTWFIFAKWTNSPKRHCCQPFVFWTSPNATWESKDSAICWTRLTWGT